MSVVILSVTRILSKKLGHIKDKRYVEGSSSPKKINKEHLPSALELVDTLNLLSIFWDSQQPISQMKKPRKDEWPAQSYLVPKCRSYTANLCPCPQGLCLCPLSLSEEELKRQRTPPGQTPVEAELLTALSRWEAAQETSRPPHKSSRLWVEWSRCSAQGHIPVWGRRPEAFH